jgi:glucan biosynthesis protein C
VKVAATAVPAHEGEIRPVRSRDLSIDYLRTTLTLMVLAHHSSLAYTSWAFFDKQNIFRSTSPVVDSTRWTFFDYAENFNDVFFMSLMFFVSGLFVYPALRRHGVFAFVRDRALRLGVPFAFAILVLMPIAYYASWQLSAQNNGFVDFYKHLAAGGFIAGPPWFIWLLLAFDVVLAVLVAPVQRGLAGVGRFMVGLKDWPVATFAGMFFLSGLVYLPLLSRYGFGAWTNFIVSPFSFQIARIGLYALWFVAGFLVGVPGYGEGLLSHSGGLARRWRLWIAVCVVAYNALWFVPRSAMAQGMSVSGRGALEAVLWVVSCVASCFGFLALFRGVELTSRAWMNSLARCAYGMYLVHYVFVLWLQRVVLDRPIPAGIKFLFVFLGTTLLSWLATQAALRVPKVKTIL